MSRAKNKHPTALDLFSGCGGLTLGLKKAGFNVLSAIEIDTLATETYARNHPEVILLNQDIRKIEISDLRKSLNLRKGQLDLLAGCPPCQGFSTLRTYRQSKSVSDQRNNLMFDFLNFVFEFLPKTIMMENVPGLIQGRRIKRFNDELVSLGYIVNYNVINVADYGVPQRRKRFILMASRNGRIEFAPHAKKKALVKDALSKVGNPILSNDPAHNHGEERSEKIKEIISLIPKDGGSRASLPRRLWMDCHKSTDGFNDIYGRIKWNDLAPTITGGCINPSKGRFLHPWENRAITVREAALLQSFPKNYFFSMREGKYNAALMVGNALPPEFIKRQALQIKSHLSSAFN